ncbi:MAG TPA: glycosyl hydrolase, partial [Actinomycetota bacterium]|nr:glycosyl hydrolase [Actinomycetota bacterium]
SRITDIDLPSRWITRVRYDDRDARIAYVTYSGYRNGDNAAHVLRSDDGGTGWRDISGNLPVVPVNDVVTLGDLVIVATDVGVFATAGAASAEPTWIAVGAGLPNVPVLDLRAFDDGRLFAATFGRGMYRVSISSALD